MGTLLAYNLKLSICFILFYFLYKLLFSHETFHRANRFILLAFCCIVLLVPFVNIEWGRQSAVHDTISSYELALTNSLPSEFESQSLASNANEGINPAVDNSGVLGVLAGISWTKVLISIYFLGILFFTIRMLYSHLHIAYLVYAKSRKMKMENGTIAIHNKDIAPFSWMKFVVISERDYALDGNMIILHELSHLKQYHAIDLIFIKVISIFQWFNPIMWFINKELQDIHEYEADKYVLGTGVDAKKYQLLLIKETVGAPLFNSLVNSFNHSKLKKRIAMMTKEKSKKRAGWKYLLVLPLIALSIVVFAKSKDIEVLNKISAVEISEDVDVKSERKKIEGTWKMVEANNFGQGEGYYSMKLITEDSFVWYRYNSKGDIITGAGGKYTFENNIYTESIDFTLEGMHSWKGKKAIVEVKFEGDKMITKGKLDDKVTIYEEKWEKVE